MSTAAPLLSPELLAQLERLELVSRKIFRGRMKGERRSRRKGQSVEFADFRQYVPGDDLRFVDWNTFARLERLFLKMFLEEEDLHFYAVIDASPSMDFGEPTKYDYARQLAAALGFVGLVRGDRVKIQTLGQPANHPAPVLRGRRSLWRMMEYLEGIEPGEIVPLADGLKQFCLRNSGKGIVVLSPITTWLKRPSSSMGGASARNTCFSTRCNAASRNFTKAGVKRWAIAFSVTHNPSCAAVV